MYELTVGKKQYIGVTVKCFHSAAKSLRCRVSKHWYRRMEDGKNHWNLYKEIRKLEDRSQIGQRVVAVIRGKTQAHAFERELIRELKPTLNTDKRGC